MQGHRNLAARGRGPWKIYGLWVALAAIVSLAISAGSAWAQPPTTPAASAAAAAALTPAPAKTGSEKVEPAPVPCPAPSEFRMTMAAVQAVQRLEVIPTGRFSEGWDNTILVTRPTGADDLEQLRLRAFTVEKNGAQMAYPVRRARPPEDSFAKASSLTDPGAWMQVRLAGADAKGLLPLRPMFETRMLVVLACKGPLLIAVGEAPVLWVAFRYAQLAGIGMGVAIYLMTVVAARALWRRQASRSATTGAGGAAAAPATPLRWFETTQVGPLRFLDPVVAVGDTFGRGSLSKLQVLAFTVVIVGGLTMVLLLRGTLIELSTSVVWLLGIPAAGAIGSQLTSLSQDRISTANWAWLVGRGILPVNDRKSHLPRWRDVLTTNEELDLYKVQAAAFSMLVLMGMLISMSTIDTFNVPDSVLAVLGLSQGLLVGGGFVKPKTLGDLDNLITELKVRERVLRSAAATGLDVDAEGRAVTGATPAPGAPFASLAAAAASAATPVAATRYVDLAREVEVLLEGLTHSDVDTKRLLDPPLGDIGV